MKRIELLNGCEDCEQERRNNMTIGDNFRIEINNKELNNDEIAKIMAKTFKIAGGLFVSFDEEKIKEILNKKIKPTLSDAERVILENINTDFKWIARDEEGELYGYIKVPIKTQEGTWEYELDNVSEVISLRAFEHLFKFIEWKDEEPYSIEKLLKEDEDV